MAATADLLLTDKASADKAIKKLSGLFKRAGQPIILSEFDEKPKRTAGVTYRELLLVVASGQKITVRVTAEGDIFRVLLNGSALPLKNQTDVAKAVGEIAKAAERNQAAFQRKQARIKVAIPKGMTTPRPKMIDTLRQQVAELDTAISAREARVVELRQQLGMPMLDSVTAGALAGLQAAGAGAVDVLRALGRSGGLLSDDRVPSVLGRDALVRLGAVDRHTVHGDNELSPAGEKLLAAYERDRPAPMLDSMPKLGQSELETLLRLAEVGVLAPDEFDDADTLKALMDKGLVTEHETGLCVVSEAGEQALNAEGYSIYGEPLAA